MVLLVKRCSSHLVLLFSKISQGGEVPEKYYMDSEELLAHMTKTTIPRGDKLLVKFDVQQEGCILR